MGGRGSASGFSVGKDGSPKNKYGSQYHTILESENIKFVTKNTRDSETLMETQTPGRIYVEVGGKDLLRVVFFDKDNRRNHVIERDKRTNEWHTHNGYLHSEYGGAQHEPLSDDDKQILAKIKKLWYNHTQV
jgi:hypothetical protein